jgi:hypothetical protein
LLDGGRSLLSANHRDLLRALIDDGVGAAVTCAGASMLPTLAPGQEVFVRKACDVRAGDVVLIQTGGDNLVLHRVLFAHPRLPLCIHAGDRPGALASLVKKTQVLGRADLPRVVPPVSRRVRGAGQAFLSVLQGKV